MKKTQKRGQIKEQAAYPAKLQLALHVARISLNSTVLPIHSDGTLSSPLLVCIISFGPQPVRDTLSTFARVKPCQPTYQRGELSSGHCTKQKTQKVDVRKVSE